MERNMPWQNVIFSSAIGVGTALLQREIWPEFLGGVSIIHSLRFGATIVEFHSFRVQVASYNISK